MFHGQLLLSNMIIFRYENKGVKWMKSRASALPPGYHPDEEKPSNTAGLSKASKRSLRRKEQKKRIAAAAAGGVDTVTGSMAAASISSKDKTKASNSGQPKRKRKPKELGSSATTATPEAAEPSKKLRNLKKKLRQIEDLEGKIKSGDLKNPDKAQQEKVAKKQELIKEINELEKKL